MLFQQRLLLFRQPLLHHLQFLKSIFEDGLLRIFRIHGNGRQQDRLGSNRTIRDIRQVLNVLVPRELYGCFGRCTRLSTHGFVDSHQLRAVEDEFDGGEICALPDQPLSSSAWIAPPATESFEATIAVGGTLSFCNSLVTRTYASVAPHSGTQRSARTCMSPRSI